MAKAKEDTNYKVIADNRRARYDYAIEEDIECGIVLMGSEVKSLRQGGSNIAESYAAVEDGELYLTNAYIAPYDRAMFGHEERRKRKLLVSRRELGSCDAPRINDLAETLRKRGLDGLQFFAEGCRNGKKVRIAFDEFANRTGREVIGGC